MTQLEYGVMTGREFEARVAEFAVPSIAKAARREVLDWKGIKVELRDGRTFSVPHAHMMREVLKAAGFRWVNDTRRWETEDARVVAKCPELVRKAKGAAKEALKNVMRVQDASDTFARAASRLARGDVETVKGTLKRDGAAAIREAMGILAADDQDKATVVNGRGFSKADTELGHSLMLMGVTTFTQAALALRLTWKYRAQLPPNLITAAFPMHEQGVVEFEEVTDAPTELTLLQAQELVAGPVEVIEHIRTSSVAIRDAQPEPELSKPPFLRETRNPVARIEGGAVLLLVTKNKRPVRLEVRLAACFRIRHSTQPEKTLQRASLTFTGKGGVFDS